MRSRYAKLRWARRVAVLDQSESLAEDCQAQVHWRPLKKGYILFFGPVGRPADPVGDSFLNFFDGFGDFRPQILIRICSFCYSRLPGATVLSNDENFIDFRRFEFFMKKWKMNYEKHIFWRFGQFGGFHPTPEVKLCLYTKFEVHRRELEKIESLKTAPGPRQVAMRQVLDAAPFIAPFRNFWACRPLRRPSFYELWVEFLFIF